MSKLNVCLINDSFPPLVDGIANAIVNYGHVINTELGSATACVPYYPDADDSRYDFDVVRFKSLDTMGLVGYRAGVPFDAKTIELLKEKDFDIIHSHCPIASSMLGRVLRDEIDKPMVFTYHTKYDIDIQHSLRGHLIQEEAKKMLVDNVAASDEVWVVSDGAGKNLQSIGYEGDYIVMRNGVDMRKGRVSDELIQAVTGEYDLPTDVPMYLFVGRIMWYKGMRIILDALKALDSEGKDFRMVFVGGGVDKAEIVLYAQSLNLGNKVIFVDAISDRDELRAWYSRANLFLFPSTFDTNGLVVREASAAGLASVLVRGSCAAEDTKDFVNSFWIDENAESMHALLTYLGDDLEKMRRIGENAQRDLYISWEDSIKTAYERYGVVIDNYNAGLCPTHDKLTDHFFEQSSAAIDDLIRRQQFRQNLILQAENDIAEMFEGVEAFTERVYDQREKLRYARKNFRDERKRKFDEKIEYIMKEFDRYK